MSDKRNDGKRKRPRDERPMSAPPPFIMRICNAPSKKLEFTGEEKTYMTTHLSAEERLELRGMLRRMRPEREPRRLRVLRSALPWKVKADIFRQLMENESSKYEEWVERALRLPLDRFTTPPKRAHEHFLERARERMDAEITGHEEAKHEVLRQVCTWLHAGAHAGFAIGLEGEPGIGKTSFVKRALSQCMERPFCFVGLGGASDASVLLGHAYTYEGALPGRLAECVTTTGVMDPIIFFDELDKISTSGKGDELVNALIHLTDPVQNSHLRDRYFHGIDLDLSRAVLVFSYNDPSRVHPVLLDRIKRIHMGAPSHAQRIEICARHLLPRALLADESATELPAEVIDFLVRRAEGEAGMRSVEKELAHVIASYRLARTMGSAAVLGVDAAVRLDLPFARAVLGPDPASPRVVSMMYT